MVINREIHLKQRPVGLPKLSDFELAEVPLRELAEGEVLVRNHYMSVDPYMRGRMIERKSYTPPFKLGEPLTGGCVGQVLESRGNALPAGAYVLGFEGWREYYISDGSGLTPVDPRIVPLKSYLGVMGMPGMTAYVGLLDIGQAKEGDMVFVSAAAGAVGGVVCQIAKINGCRVVGTAGSPAKVAWLKDEIGIDGAINYKESTDLTREVSKFCPNGIDVYFDNVGGEHLEAALALMNNNGRLVECGMIGQYNATEPCVAPRNLNVVVGKRLMMKGFIVSDHYDRLPQFHADMGGWIATGKMKIQETILEGLENAPQAFINLFTGENFGKMLVKL